MTATTNQRLVSAWIVLSAITAASWWIGSGHGSAAFVPNSAITCGVILMAALKVRVIVSEFMEVRRAAVTLRRLMDGWLVTLVALMLGVSFVGL
jgi:hypothetical protein